MSRLRRSNRQQIFYFYKHIAPNGAETVKSAILFISILYLSFNGKDNFEKRG